MLAVIGLYKVKGITDGFSKYPLTFSWTIFSMDGMCFEINNASDIGST
jgi:hypothetical protein